MFLFFGVFLFCKNTFFSMEIKFVRYWEYEIGRKMIFVFQKKDRNLPTKFYFWKKRKDLYIFFQLWADYQRLTTLIGTMFLPWRIFTSLLFIKRFMEFSCNYRKTREIVYISFYKTCIQPTWGSNNIRRESLNVS